MKKYFISILFLSTISFAEIISPEDNVTLNYRHVLFQWEQVPNATNYVITIYNESTGEYAIDTVESLIYINDTFLDWDLSYTWYVTPMFSDGSLGASIEDSNGSTYLTFNTGQARSSANTITYNENQYSEGITIFSSFLARAFCKYWILSLESFAYLVLGYFVTIILKYFSASIVKPGSLPSLDTCE